MAAAGVIVTWDIVPVPPLPIPPLLPATWEEVADLEDSLSLTLRPTITSPASLVLPPR